MDDYIKRKDAINALCDAVDDKCDNNKGEWLYTDEFCKAINGVPSADVVERKCGEWIGDRCSICGEERAWYGCQPPFCPDCGTRMKGADDEISCR